MGNESGREEQFLQSRKDVLQSFQDLLPITTSLNSHPFFQLPTYSSVFSSLFMANVYGKRSFVKRNNPNEIISTKKKLKPTPNSTSILFPPPLYSDKNTTSLQSLNLLQNELERASFDSKERVTHAHENIAIINQPAKASNSDIRNDMKVKMASLDTNKRNNSSVELLLSQKSAWGRLTQGFRKSLDRFLTAIIIMSVKITELITTWYDIIYSHEILTILYPAYKVNYDLIERAGGDLSQDVGEIVSRWDLVSFHELESLQE